mmetsp:Transcript_39244/g.87751  ORF Transcript_39244/g.87751 Transcript_39244/m.87751 type:complete len:268 (+) Transcript_39244:427-1230(+)
MALSKPTRGDDVENPDTIESSSDGQGGEDGRDPVAVLSAVVSPSSSSGKAGDPVCRTDRDHSAALLFMDLLRRFGLASNLALSWAMAATFASAAAFASTAALASVTALASSLSSFLETALASPSCCVASAALMAASSCSCFILWVAVCNMASCMTRNDSTSARCMARRESRSSTCFCMSSLWASSLASFSALRLSTTSACRLASSKERASASSFKRATSLSRDSAFAAIASHSAVKVVIDSSLSSAARRSASWQSSWPPPRVPGSSE